LKSLIKAGKLIACNCRKDCILSKKRPCKCKGECSEYCSCPCNRNSNTQTFQSTQNSDISSIYQPSTSSETQEITKITCTNCDETVQILTDVFRCDDCKKICHNQMKCRVSGIDQKGPYIRCWKCQTAP
jgi:hypothetical protein